MRFLPKEVSIMAKMYRLVRVLLLAVLVMSFVAACSDSAAVTPTTTNPNTGAGPGAVTATTAGGVATAASSGQTSGSGAMTDVGTPRSETLIVQTFDGKTDTPDNFNPLMGQPWVWRGFRELGWGFLWEMD